MTALLKGGTSLRSLGDTIAIAAAEIIPEAARTTKR